MIRRLLVPSAAAVALLFSATSAQAKILVAHNIVSPSGLISCNAIKYGGPGLNCTATYLPSIGEFDPYFRLRPTGRTVYSQRSDYDGFPNAKQRVLHYGDVWAWKKIRCTMAKSGLTCRNPKGHGFHLAVGAIRRF